MFVAGSSDGISEEPPYVLEPLTTAPTPGGVTHGPATPETSISQIQQEGASLGAQSLEQLKYYPMEATQVNQRMTTI